MARTSRFKLFLHCQRGGALGILRQYRDAKGVVPEWIKVCRWNHCTEVKAIDPQIKTLLRDPELSEQGIWIDHGYEGGRAFVRELRARSGDDWRNVTAIEFTNEQTTFDDVRRVEQVNTAALGFVAECVAQGKLPAVPCNSVANPKLELVAKLGPCAEASVRAGGFYAPHAYGPRAMFDQAELYVNCWIPQVATLRAAGYNIPYSQVLITEFSYDYLSSYRDSNGQNTSGPWRWIGISIEQVKADFLRYANMLANMGVAGAMMYDCYAYNSLSNENYVVNAIERGEFDDPHTARLMDWLDDESVPAEYKENYNRALALANAKSADAALAVDPYELIDDSVNLIDWYGEQLAATTAPAPTIPAHVWTKPGGTFSAAYLRGQANESERMGWSDRGTRLNVEGKVGRYYKVSAYIPDWLVSLTPPAVNAVNAADAEGNDDAKN